MKNSKVLALDYGKRRIGAATGDLSLGIAFPRKVILNKGFEAVFAEISSMVEEFSISIIVIGLPLSMEEGQKENVILNEVRDFVELLQERLPEVKIELFDERLSSYEADQLMNDQLVVETGSLGRDAYAAQVILQRFFDRNNV